MPLRDLLHKKPKAEGDEIEASGPPPPNVNYPTRPDPRFTILRTDSTIEEPLSPPSDTPPPAVDDTSMHNFSRPLNRHAHHASAPAVPLYPSPAVESRTEPEATGSFERVSSWRRRRSTASPAPSSGGSSAASPDRRSDKSGGSERRLSSIFHRASPSRSSRRSRSASLLPDELEHIDDTSTDPEEREAQWERRATVLAQSGASLELPREGGNGAGRPRRISDAQSDDDIQRAIQLHESGDLEASTAMFGRLADPEGVNSALSQVLYGLALRHGWGIPPDPPRAVYYLSCAARNSAAIESLALSAGMKKGGAAKGELVLAIYELANCYRMGLGIAKDPEAARLYFETAARLGDLDAMEATARCYEDGIGGKKDKFKAAAYYRRAEEQGRKIVGNSWIWKDKYNPKEVI